MALFFGKKRNKYTYKEIAPDEILLDSSNIPKYDKDQFEGRLESPISKPTLYGIVLVALLILAIFTFQAGKMQVVNGDEYYIRSTKNILRPVPIFAGRGVVFDRNNIPLIWNSPKEEFFKREYATTTGFAHLLGYVQYPTKDSNGFYYREDFEGVSGVEKYFNDLLKGKSGSRLVEVNARGQVISENTIQNPELGKNINLSIDARLQHAMFENIKYIAESVGYKGGAGLIMDVNTGEVLTITSYPEFSSQLMSDKESAQDVRKMLTDSRLLFLNRATDGLYTPGSIVKPYVAIGALNEKVIDPNTVIVTKGFITIPNPYNPDLSTTFRDWKNLGPVNMRQAIAMSSDVYFYTIGGGYKDQKGLGILNIDKYLQIFGFGLPIADGFFASKAGNIPTPEWKKKTFKEDWYLGNTYHTAIGQYGFQVTPIQIVRAVSAIANGGNVLQPAILKGEQATTTNEINIPSKYFDVIKQGMRLGVTEGTGKNLNVSYVSIASKSGTAELGVAKDRVNSWITGFFPYEKPKYAFTVIMENGSVHNLVGAVAVMRRQLDWMKENTPEYFSTGPTSCALGPTCD
jgi:penicillin-binding protein 2